MSQSRSTLNASSVASTKLVVLRWSCAILAGLIFSLISLGGLVRNAGAGLSCPDWPLCYGKVVPPMDYQIFLEWFHRLIAGSVSLFLLGISAVIFSNKELRTRFAKYCIAAISLLAVQIVLGGLTVLHLLSPKWVSSHLAVGMAFFGVILLLALDVWDYGTRSKTPSSARKSFGNLVWLAPLAVYLQVILGGLVSSNAAGLACPDFPTCNGAWVPELQGLVKFQFAHRLGSLAVTVVVATLIFKLWGSKVSRRLSLASWSLPVFLFTQLTLGIGSVLFQLPLLMSVAHLAVAAALFGTLLVVRYETRV